MTILTVKNLTKYYGTTLILDNANFGINQNEKVGIVGPNGIGKTTLFKLLVNEIDKDSGEIFWSKNVELEYLKQNIISQSDLTLYEEVTIIFQNTIRLENELRELEIKIAENHDSENLQTFMDDYTKKTEYFNSINGFSYKSELIGILNGLGFSQSDFNKPVKLLSGGEQTRLNLSKLLLRKPEVLLLDEPTNHLDSNSIEWLESYLKQYKGTVFIISHDRYFLDRVVDSIIEIKNKKTHYYFGNYTEYLKKRNQLKFIEEKKYKENIKEIKKQQNVIDKLKSFGREKQLKRARSREKMLNKMDKIDKPIDIDYHSKIRFIPEINSGFEVMKVQNISKSFPDKELFSNINFEIFRGDKVALIGRNGIGKSTLFNIILSKDSDYTGQIIFGTNVNPFYFDQKRMDLNLDNTIIDEIWNRYPNLDQTTIRNYLASFLFKGDDVFKTISSLSGGEQSRISLLKLMLSNSNFIFLDEPTNHLDIESKEVLEKALTSYEGSLFFISHDRYFINSIANKIIEMTEEGIRIFFGNYDDYQYSIQAEKELIQKHENENKIPVNKTKLKQDYKKEKAKNNELKKLKKELIDIENKIYKIESDLKEVDELMCIEEVYSSPDKISETVSKKAKLEEQLEKEMLNWEILSSKLENI